MHRWTAVLGILLVACGPEATFEAERASWNELKPRAYGFTRENRGAEEGAKCFNNRFVEVRDDAVVRVGCTAYPGSLAHMPEDAISTDAMAIHMMCVWAPDVATTASGEAVVVYRQEFVELPEECRGESLDRVFDELHPDFDVSFHQDWHFPVAVRWSRGGDHGSIEIANFRVLDR